MSKEFEIKQKSIVIKEKQLKEDCEKLNEKLSDNA